MRQMIAKFVDELLFQSHIGAIRIPEIFNIKSIARLFQSHIGAIRMHENDVLNDLVSIFQSHIGAIRIETLPRVSVQRTLHFNPTLVQLE